MGNLSAFKSNVILFYDRCTLFLFEHVKFHTQHQHIVLHLSDEVTDKINKPAHSHVHVGGSDAVFDFVSSAQYVVSWNQGWYWYWVRKQI